jgi:hypothetical protein
VGAVGAVFIGGEGAAERERRAEQAEVIGRDANTVDLFGVCAAGQVEAGAAVFVGGDVLEGGGLAAKHVELRCRSAITGAGGCGLEEQDDAIGGGVSQRPQQDGVDDRENGGVRSDAEGQGSQSGGGECGRPPERTVGIADVVEESFDVVHGCTHSMPD